MIPLWHSTTQTYNMLCYSQSVYIRSLIQTFCIYLFEGEHKIFDRVFLVYNTFARLRTLIHFCPFAYRVFHTWLRSCVLFIFIIFHCVYIFSPRPPLSLSLSFWKCVCVCVWRSFHPNHFLLWFYIQI